MKSKRFMVAFVGMTMVMTMLAGCGSNSTSGSSASASASSNEVSNVNSVSASSAGVSGSSVASTGGKASSDIHVAGMIYLEDNFMKQLSAGYKAAADEQGVNYVEYNCNQDQASESQTINTYVSQGLDGFAIAPLNEDSSIAACKSAAESGLKVVLCDSTLKDGNFLVGGYTSDQSQLGESTGEAAKKWLKDNGYSKDNPCPIAVVCFDSLLPQKSGDRVDGFLNAVGDSVKVVDKEDAWEQDKAIETVKNMLTAHPEIKMIYAANDGGTIGATMAVENNGYAGSVSVFGIDASKQMAQLLQDKYDVLQAVTGQDGYTMGYNAMKLLIQSIKGENTGVKAGSTLTVDGILLSRDDTKGIDDYIAKWDKIVGD